MTNETANAAKPAAKQTENALNKKGTNQIKKSRISRALRDKINEREVAEDSAIIERFKKTLLTAGATQSDIATAITPTSYSTIKADIDYNEEGTMKRNTLGNLLKTAYDEAEQEMRQVLETDFDAKFKAKENHTTEELKELDELCKKIQHPFKGKFHEAPAADKAA